MTGYTVVVDKSTVPVGTAKKVEAMAPIAKHEFDVVSNPEFLKEGAAIDDFLKPDRVVIGADTEKAASIMTELYEPFVRTGNPIPAIAASAELTKYAAADARHADLLHERDRQRVRTRGSRRGQRAQGHRLRRPHRLALPLRGDRVRRLVLPEGREGDHPHRGLLGYDFKILKAVEDVNASQKLIMYLKIVQHFGEDLSGKRVALWGLAFKPNTDDMRRRPRSSSPALSGPLERRSSPTTPRPWRSRASTTSGTRSSTPTRPCRPSTARMPWSPSPSGTSSAGRTSTLSRPR